MTDPVGGETPQFTREEVEALLPEWLHAIAGPLAGIEQSKAAQFDALRSPASILGTALTSALIAQPELGPIVGRTLSALLLAKKLREIPQIGHELKLALQNKDSERISRIISDLAPISIGIPIFYHPGSGKWNQKDPYRTPRWTSAHQRGYQISRTIIRPKVESILEDAAPRIRELVPDAHIGFRGSLARGYKGSQKDYVPFEPRNFDVDGFIISDKLAGKIPLKKGGRYITKDNFPELYEEQVRLRKQFGNLVPKGNKFQFRVFSRAEQHSEISHDPYVLIRYAH